MNHFVVPVDVYCREVLFVFHESEEDIVEALAQYGEKGEKFTKRFRKAKKDFKGICMTDKQRRICVIIRCDTIENASDHEYIAHEIFHVAEAIMEHAGVEHSTCASEAWAYLIGHITNCVYHSLTKTDE